MAISRDHELHHRRMGRNVGLGVILGAFVALVFALTMVKVSYWDKDTLAPPGVGKPAAEARP